MHGMLTAKAARHKQHDFYFGIPADKSRMLAYTAAPEFRIAVEARCIACHGAQKVGRAT